MQHPLENNPIRHMQQIKAQLRQIINHLRFDVGRMTEAKARALFETSAEVLSGLVKTYDDYENTLNRHGNLRSRRSSRKEEPATPITAEELGAFHARSG
jgi:hypothetical protein